MNAITFYSHEGRIEYCVYGDKPVIEASKSHAQLPYLNGSWDERTHYVDNGMALPKPDNPSVLDGSWLRNVPVPSIIEINGQPYPTNEADVELSFAYPATYRVVVRSWPYLDKEFQIENQT